MVNIVTRSGWGARYTIPGNRGVARSDRRYCVWHYPGGNAGNDGAANCRAYEQQHKNQGWDACPGYNLLISRSGIIYEGCGLDVRGIHSPPHNTDGIGVQMMLNVGEAVPAACANAGRALYNWLNQQMGRTLTPWWHGRDYATACPGNQIVAWVQAGMPATGAPPSGGGGSAPPSTSTAPAFTATPYIDQRTNARHGDVRTWQNRMAARGWRLTIDGVYGPESERVCRSFQGEKSLAVDGKVGPQTWAAAWSAPVT